MEEHKEKQLNQLSSEIELLTERYFKKGVHPAIICASLMGGLVELLIRLGLGKEEIKKTVIGIAERSLSPKMEESIDRLIKLRDYNCK